MNISRLVARMRYIYHINMLDVNNALNQLKMRSDDKAKEKSDYHGMKAANYLKCLIYDVQ